MTDKRKRRLTDAEKAEIIDLVRSGLPAKEVASTYNVHWSTVYRMVIKANHTANPPVPPPPTWWQRALSWVWPI